MTKNTIVLTCAPGIMPILAAEVTKLRYSVVGTDRLSVTVQGDFDDCMYLNLHLRTANKVLYLLRAFRAEAVEDFYKALNAMPWEEYIGVDGYVSVNGFVRNDDIKDSRFANLKAKDAIVDRINARKGRRPDSGPDQDKTMIYIHWKGSDARVYIDTSGSTLAKHGYRKQPFKAPMQESLAAACLLASRWDTNSPFINPMCGSGTLAIEAAWLAMNKAPGLMRRNFGFMHVSLYRPQKWRQLRREAESRIDTRNMPVINASDIDPAALRAARENAHAAGVADFIDFECKDFKAGQLPPEKGVIFLNPEYGIRLGELEKLETIYADIGHFFKQQATGYLGYVFTANPLLAKKIGLKTKRRVELYTARLEARLLEYELYPGSKKIK